MNEDLIAKLRAVKVRTPEEVMAQRGSKIQRVRGIISQESWINWYNKQEGREMASMADMYAGFKVWCEQDPESVEREYQMFRKRGGVVIITSTRIKYPINNIYAEIMPRFTGKKSDFDQARLSQHPICEGERLVHVLQTKIGLDFFHELFETNDSPEKIANVLAYTSNTKETEIYVYISSKDLATTQNRTKCAAAFYYNGRNRFIVSASEKPAVAGCSYEVIGNE